MLKDKSDRGYLSVLLCQTGPTVFRFVDLLNSAPIVTHGFGDLVAVTDTHNTEVHEPSIERIDIRDETFTSQHYSQILAMSDLGGS